MKLKMLLLLIITSMIFCGCNTQVNERMYVQLLALAENDGIYTLTLQTYDAGETEANTAAAPSYSVYSANGRSITEAAAAIEREQGRKVFLGHCSLIAANSSILTDKSRLTALAGERISIGCPIIYSEEPEKLAEKRNEDDKIIGADAILGALSAAEGAGIYSPITLKEVIESADSGSIIALPMSENGEIISGTAILAKDSTYTLNLAHTAAFNLLTGSKGVRFTDRFGSAVIEKNEKSVYYKMNENGGEYYVELDLTFSADELAENSDVQMVSREICRAATLCTEEILKTACEGGFLSLIIPDNYHKNDSNISFNVSCNVHC